MSAERVLLGGVLAPLPVVLVSDTADRFASIALVLAVILAGLAVLVRHAVAELALQRECDRPIAAATDTAATVGALTDACAELYEARRRLAEFNDGVTR